MSVENGLVQYIQAGLGAPSIAPGGWAVMLPENQISAAMPMAWVYHSLTEEPNYVLEGEDSLSEWSVAIDCHGYTMAYAIQLALAIKRTLSGGFRGNFADPDSTYVQGIFRRSPRGDGFSDFTRSYVRSLEYCIHYNQT